jgi:hypothetical protein
MTLKGSQTLTSKRVPMGYRRGRYRSLLETHIAKQLEDAGVTYEYENLTLAYVVEHKYKPDFVLPNGVIIEVKGWFTSEDRGKMLRVKKDHPDLDIRMLFGGSLNTKISKTSKTTYGSWCEKHGFPCASRILPESWLK